MNHAVHWRMELTNKVPPAERKGGHPGSTSTDPEISGISGPAEDSAGLNGRKITRRLLLAVWSPRQARFRQTTDLPGATPAAT